MNAELITSFAQASSTEPSVQRNESARISIYPPGYCCVSEKKHGCADPRQKQLDSATTACPMTCVRVKIQDLN
jgi:hypothetical protein